MTAAKLAKELNVSRTTVSLVLNGRAQRYGLSPETVRRVLDAARRFNNHPDPVARQMVGMRSNVIGILANSSKLVDPRLIEKMEVRAAEKQLRFIVGYATDDAANIRQYLRDFRSRRVEAIIAFSHNHPTYRGRLLDELQRDTGRILYYEKPIAGVRDPWYVEVDYYEMGRLAAQHLIDQGRRRIGLIGLDESIFPVLRERRRGFQDALRKAGLPTRGLFWQVDEKRSLDWSVPPGEQDAAQVVEELVVKQKCDGLFAINDLYAARLVNVLRRLGRRVPEDVAVVGADNMDISTLVEPQITTVDVRIDALAEATVGLLFEMLHPDDADGRSSGSASAPGGAGRGIGVKPKLVVRQTAWRRR
jgi:DNA-binding LacI/PurR family transcriptional regulator